MASNGKTPEKLKAAGSFLMKVFGVLAVCVLSLFYFALEVGKWVRWVAGQNRSFYLTGRAG